jgi:hypothetical protein
VFQAYKEFIVEVAVVLTREAGENVPIEEIRASAEDLYLFEKQLARVSTNPRVSLINGISS